jgi:hypothetical protein
LAGDTEIPTKSLLSLKNLPHPASRMSANAASETVGPFHVLVKRIISILLKPPARSLNIGGIFKAKLHITAKLNLLSYLNSALIDLDAN